jgi:adenylate cyclase
LDREQRRLAAIVAADVVGYSRLMGRDESGTVARLREHRKQRFEPTLARHGGRLVKLTGDGALAEFPSAVDALGAAIEFQQAMAETNEGQPEEARIVFRIGLHLGDLIVDGDDLYGDGVNIAARLEAEAPPGGIVVSRAVREAVEGRLKAKLSALGELSLKNIERPIRAFRVEWEASDWQATEVQALRIEPVVPSAPVLALPDKPSIAVLPFQNMSGDSEQEYFTDGMVEDIITSLSRLSGFFVIARNSTFTYKGKAVGIKQVSRELGVRYVLEGSVRKAGNRVRVTAQLIEGATGNHVWAERYDRDLADIFAVQDEITETIVGALEPRLQVAEIIRAQHKTPSSLDAWDLVVQAMDRISRFTDTDSRAAIEMLDRAISIDPRYARAHAHKAWVTVWRGFQGWDPMGEAIATASDSVAKGRQFDADEPWVYVARIMVCVATRNGREGITAGRKAVELNPNFAYGYSFLGAALACSGDGDAALAAIDRAVRLSPRDLLHDEFDLFYAFAQFQKGDYARAAEFAASAASLRPGHAYPYRMLAASSALVGDLQRAAAALADILALTPGFNLAHAESQNVYQRDEDRARLIEGLRLAGLPE